MQLRALLSPARGYTRPRCYRSLNLASPPSRRCRRACSWVRGPDTKAAGAVLDLAEDDLAEDQAGGRRGHVVAVAAEGGLDQELGAGLEPSNDIFRKGEVFISIPSRLDGR